MKHQLIAAALAPLVLLGAASGQDADATTVSSGTAEVGDPVNIPGDTDNITVGGGDPVNIPESIGEDELPDYLRDFDGDGDVERYWIEPDLVDCEGVGPQECMVVRTSEKGEPSFFFDTIEGFTHVGGTSYVIDVFRTEVDTEGLADASGFRWQLIEIIEERRAPPSDSSGH